MGHNPNIPYFKGVSRMVAFKVHIPNMLNGFHVGIRNTTTVFSVLTPWQAPEVVRGIGRFVEISAKAAMVIKPI